ncbi:MAG: efflux RND transporter periplasmic adaptor subunit [Saprospiraceae bacterium]|nr:efflux RND transporter periplasmic adaptor subunit [Saprospiraceae bacterium]
MRRFNILYLAIPLVIWALFSIYRHLNRGTASFYGVAENQETQINLDNDVTVNRIFVTPGQFVRKGTLLLEVTRSALDVKMSDLNFNISELQARDQLRLAGIRSDLDRLRAERAEKIGEIQSQIRLLESEQGLNRSLVREIKSIRMSDTLTDQSLHNTKIQALRDELRLALEPIDVEMARLQKELTLAGIPDQTQISKLKKEVDFYHQEQERLQILAPSDGLAGTIHCRPGENIPAFNTMISFYEQNPNTVVAYVHESLILEIKVGDSLNVVSSLHPAEQCRGRVSGLGHRVVEIPERLRKFPEIKSYGREVLINIPPANNFLQKEKVLLQRLGAGKGSLFSLFTQPPSPGS